MKTGPKGFMNIDFSEVYDSEDDTYYVSFKTGEPSYCKEVDDVILLEVGLFSNLPTGFRILNFRKNKVQSVAILLEKVKRATEQLSKKTGPTLEDRRSRVEQALEKVFA